MQWTLENCLSEIDVQGVSPMLRTTNSHSPHNALHPTNYLWVIIGAFEAREHPSIHVIYGIHEASPATVVYQ